MRWDNKETKGKREGDPVSEMSSSLEDVGFESWRQRGGLFSSSVLSLSSMDPSLRHSYRILSSQLTFGSSLGKGAFGEVFSGTWRTNPVAIKRLHRQTLSSETEAELLHEVEILSQIRCAQIVTLYGICLDQSPYCLVMEFMPKGSLYQLLHSTQELPWSLRYTLSLDIAVGLSHLHDHDILHGDLKSLNILIDDRGRAKMSDCGLSKIKTHTRTLTRPKTEPGTLRSLLWMAPEVFKRGGKPTLASDVYSLAMILWEISSRKTPWEEAEDSSLISAWVVEGERETIPEHCPAAFGALIQACWVGKPSQRYTAHQAVEHLQKLWKTDNDETPSTSSERIAGVLETSFSKKPTTLSGKPIGTCLQTLRGHEGYVYSLAVLPSGELASGSADKTIKVWRQEQGQYTCVETLRGHKGSVYALLALPSGELASGSFDNTIKVWRQEQGQYTCLQTLEGHTGAVYALLALPSGELASGSLDRTIKVWRREQGQYTCLETLSGHEGYVSALTVLPSGELVSGSYDHTIKVWRREQGQYTCVETLRGHTGGVWCLTVLPSGEIASGSLDRTIKVWRREQGQYTCLEALRGHTSGVLSLTVLLSGELASGSADKTINVWRREQGQYACVETLHGHTDWVRSLTVLPSGELASGSDDDTINVWEVGASPRLTLAPQDRKEGKEEKALLSTPLKQSSEPSTPLSGKPIGTCLQTLSGHTDWVRSITVLPSGEIASGSGDDTIKVWRREQGQYTCVETLRGHTNSVWSLTVLPSGELASGSWDDTIKVWRKENGQYACVQTLSGHEGYVYSLTVLPSDEIASGSSDKTIKVWRREQGQYTCLETLSGHTSGVLSLTVLASGEIASGSSDNTIKVWRREQGQYTCLETLSGHEGYVFALTVLPSGEIASGSGDDTIKVWRREQGQYICLQTLEGHTNSVYALTVLPSGEIASGSWNSIKVWRREQGRYTCVETLRGHTSYVSALTVLLSGEIASGSDDDTIKVWEVGASPRLTLQPSDRKERKEQKTESSIPTVTSSMVSPITPGHSLPVAPLSPTPSTVAPLSQAPSEIPRSGRGMTPSMPASLPLPSPARVETTEQKEGKQKALAGTMGENLLQDWQAATKGTRLAGPWQITMLASSSQTPEFSLRIFLEDRRRATAAKQLLDQIFANAITEMNSVQPTQQLDILRQIDTQLQTTLTGTTLTMSPVHENNIMDLCTLVKNAPSLKTTMSAPGLRDSSSSSSTSSSSSSSSMLPARSMDSLPLQTVATSDMSPMPEANAFVNKNFNQNKKSIGKNKTIKAFAREVQNTIEKFREDTALTKVQKLVQLGKYYGRFWELRRGRHIESQDFYTLVNVTPEEIELFKEAEDYHLLLAIEQQEFSFVQEHILPSYTTEARNAVYWYDRLSPTRILSRVKDANLFVRLCNDDDFDPLTHPQCAGREKDFHRRGLRNGLFLHELSSEQIQHLNKHRHTIVLDALAYLISTREEIEFAKFFNRYHFLIDCNAIIAEGIYTGYTIIQLICLHFHEIKLGFQNRGEEFNLYNYLESLDLTARHNILNSQFPKQDPNYPLTVLQYLIYRHNANLLFRIFPTDLALQAEDRFIVTHDSSSRWRGLNLLNLFLLGFISENYDSASFSSALTKESNTLSGKPIGTCLQTLSGHTRSVLSLTVLPSGALVSGSYDKTIKVWEASEGRYHCVQTLSGHTDWVSALTVLATGELASGARDDKMIRVWRRGQQGQYACVQTLSGHENRITSLTVLPEGEFASGAWDNTIKVWRQERGQYSCVQTLRHKHWVTSLTILPTGEFASGSADDTIKVWRRGQQGQYTCVETLRGHTEVVSALTVLPTGEIASGSWDNTIKVWRREQGQYACLQTLGDHKEHGVTSLSMLPTKYEHQITSLTVLLTGELVSGSNHNGIKVWRQEQGQYVCVQTLSGYGRSVYSLTVLPTGELVSGGSEDNTIKVWEVGVPRMTLEPNDRKESKEHKETKRKRRAEALYKPGLLEPSRDIREPEDESTGILTTQQHVSQKSRDHQSINIAGAIQLYRWITKNEHLVLLGDHTDVISILNSPTDFDREYSGHTLLQIVVLKNRLSLMEFCKTLKIELSNIINTPFPEESVLYRDWTPIQVAIYLSKRNKVDEKMIFVLVECGADLSVRYPIDSYLSGLSVFHAMVLDCCEDPYIDANMSEFNPTEVQNSGVVFSREYDSSSMPEKNYGRNFSSYLIQFVFNRLSSSEVNASCQLRQSKYYMMTALHTVLLQRNHQYASIMLDVNKTNYTVRDLEGRAALECATHSGDQTLIDLVKKAQQNFPEHIDHYYQSLKYDSEVCPSFQITPDRWIVSFVREKGSDHAFLTIEGLERDAEDGKCYAFIRLAHLVARAPIGKGKVKFLFKKQELHSGQKKTFSLLRRVADGITLILKPGSIFFPESDAVNKDLCEAIWNKILAEAHINENRYAIWSPMRSLISGNSDNQICDNCVSWALRKYNSLVKKSSQIRGDLIMYVSTHARGVLNRQFDFVRRIEEEEMSERQLFTMSKRIDNISKAQVKDVSNLNYIYNHLCALCVALVVFSVTRESGIEISLFSNRVLSFLFAIVGGGLLYMTINKDKNDLQIPASAKTRMHRIYKNKDDLRIPTSTTPDKHDFPSKETPIEDVQARTSTP